MRAISYLGLKMTNNLRMIFILAAIGLVLGCAVTSFAQTDSIESLTAAIEKEPSNADLYSKRGDLYAGLWGVDKNTEKIVSIARAAADYSKYIKLKPNSADIYRKRAAARYELFLGSNAFSIADLQKAVQLNPKDEESKAKIAQFQIDYQQMYRTSKCVDSRITNGFQGHPNDEPLTHLAGYLDSEMSETNTDALKAIACGANVNFVYKKSRDPEFANFDYYLIEHLIAMLEAGADINSRDKSDNTPLMLTLDSLFKLKSKIDDQMLERLKIAVQYGANLNAKNRKGQSVLALARKTKNTELINLLQNAGAKIM